MIQKIKIKTLKANTISIGTAPTPTYSVSIPESASENWYAGGSTPGTTTWDLAIRMVDADSVETIEYHAIPGFTNSNLVGITILGGGSASGVTVNGVFYMSDDYYANNYYLCVDIPSMTEDISITSYYCNECLLEGTPVLLADGTTKNIEDITYNDTLMSWNFDSGNSEGVKPIIIKKPDTIGNIYHRATFASGRTLDIVTGHRVLSITKGAFKYASECVGDDVMCVDGVIDRLVSYDKVNVDKNNMPRFYNVITKGNFNLYANGILTSCRLNNMYDIDTAMMVFVKPETKELKPYSDFSDILSEQMFNDLRIAEQRYETTAVRSYCDRLIKNAL